MNTLLQTIYLVRHGQTEWNLTGQHTGLTDLPLNPHGEEQALQLKSRIGNLSAAKVFTSPLSRARRTCELTGFGAVAEVDADLMEWNYGDYEGLRSVDIHAKQPDWDIFRDGCPGGESVNEVGARADRVIARFRSVTGDVLAFSSGHFLRVLAARWIKLSPTAGGLIALDNASLSVLGFEHTLNHPVIRSWNECHR